MSAFVDIPGSGRLRVTTSRDVQEAVVRRTETVVTAQEVFQAQITDFWTGLTGLGVSPTLIDRVWVASRCQQMNAQAISTMPLRFYGTREPAWVANPDPNWYPNGIGDAVFAAVWSMYGWGDAFLYVTDTYADGFPSGWTVLDPAPITVEVRNGKREYRSGQTPLDRRRVVQISRNPTGGVRGTSAISAYSAYAYGLLAAADLGRVMMSSGGTPNAVIKSAKKLGAEQAAAIQSAWMTAASARRGAPAVLGPDLTFEQLAFSPADLMLLDAQTFDSQVICSAYGVPASMVNMPIEGGLNYQTPVLLLEQWWRSELRPAAMRISRALSSNWLARGSYVEFDAREFLAPAFKELVEAWTTLAKEGHASTDEVRGGVLGLPQGEAAHLTTPPSAGASPAQQQSEGVIALRPTQQAVS